MKKSAWTNSYFDHMLVLCMNSGGIKVIIVHPQGDMNICAKVCTDPVSIH